jgi:ketopantoate reductase
VPEPIRARYVVIGGGAVGGALAAQLAPIGRSRGYDVVLVARGEHGRLVREQGLLVHRPDGTEAVGLDVVADSHGLDLRVGDVLLLTVKAQDRGPRAAPLLPGLRRHHRHPDELPHRGRHRVPIATTGRRCRLARPPPGRQ